MPVIVEFQHLLAEPVRNGANVDLLDGFLCLCQHLRTGTHCCRLSTKHSIHVGERERFAVDGPAN